MMSELEEPPAKVLKVDNIDGVTHVTELSEMPSNESFLEDQPVMGEESGIIEGGADEGQEEWLSEGVLTDDDYNPASQVSQEGDQTDSQLGSSQEEEHLDTTMESEGNDIADENNITESDPNVPESEGNLEMDSNTDDATYIESQTFTQSETYNMDTEENMLQSDNTTESVTNVTESVTNVTESVTTVTESVTNVTESITNVTESVQNVMESEENVTESEQNVADSATSVKSEENEQKTQIENVEMNIEETMEQMEGAKCTDDVKSEEFDDLLIKKTDVKSESKSVKDEIKEEQDDGNDTDDLLRMLGEDDCKTKKKLTKTVKDIRAAAAAAKKENASSDDDDDFVYEGTTVKKITAAKTVLAKKQPVKAEPEDDTDVSADDTLTVQRMFGYKKKPNILAKQQAKPSMLAKRPAQGIINVVEKPAKIPVRSQPLRQYQNKRVLKPATPQPAVKTPVKNTRTETNKTSFKPEMKTPVTFKSSILKSAEEAASRQEILDDTFNMDEDEFGESDMDHLKNRQRIMRPEMMDEEIPSDGESHSEDGSLYDEMPSSDSEDIDDWFQIDIRAEKAGDYLPLLGSKAKELLEEEERRVSSRLLTLKQSLSALTESGKRQADQLREATMALAELDDMLKAS